MSSHPLYRQHHTHSLYDITLSICVASFALYKTSHPHFMSSNHRVYVITPNIFDIVSTVSVSSTSTVVMISHQLYFWDHIRYNSWHHIHCIRHDSHRICVITPTRSIISHPFYVWHHTHYMYNIIYPIKGISSSFYDIHPHVAWHHMHSIHDITPSISDTMSTLSVSSRPVHQLYHTNSLYDITHTLCMI